MSYIGVLALQGDFHKHLAMFKSMNVDARPFKEVERLSELKGLVLPGGESTTIGMLLERRNLIAPLREAISAGLPVFGTCAGAILLARTIRESDQIRLGLMDITIVRNAYGSQVDSFEAVLDVQDPETGAIASVEGVFIRAPRIHTVGNSVRPLSWLEGSPVLVRENNMLAATFHPELTQSTALHAYFAEIMCRASN